MQRWFPWVLLFLWIVFFFPKWYFISYTKIWELRQLIGRDRFAQIQVLHSDEMDTILAVTAELKQQVFTYVVVPPGGAYPVLSVSSLWRAAAGTSQHLVSPQAVTSQMSSLIVFAPQMSTAWNPPPSVCDLGGCSCLRWPVQRVTYWRVE